MMAGTHVSLEPLRSRHVDELWPCVDDAVRRWWPLRLESPEDLAQQILHLRRMEENGTGEPFLIRMTDGRVAGTTAYYGINARQRHLTIGWTFLGPEFRRTAVNTETKLLLLGEAFDGRAMERVQFDVDARNAPSQAALRRLGAVYEGTLRRHKVLHDGFIRDTTVWSMVASEWAGIKTKLEARLTQPGTN